MIFMQKETGSENHLEKVAHFELHNFEHLDW